MSEYNLGTARGQISIDGSAAAAGFKVAQTAGNAFFLAIQSKVREVQQLGRRLAAVGAAGVGGFGLAVKAASGFESSISAVAAVTGSTGDEVDLLRKKALQLGADTAFSAGQAAEAIGELAKAGVSVEDILNGAADATTALAAAGGLGLPQAAEIAANAMNSFGISGGKAAKVADILAGAANASSADVSTLGESLSQTGAVANLAGLSLEDTVTALGEFANAGIKGSDAGTSLKTMLLNLQPTTDAQVAKFKELGLLTYSNSKAMRVLAAKGIKPLGPGLDAARKAVSKYLIENQGLEKGTKKLRTETDKFLQKNGAMQNAFFDSKGNVKDLRGLQDALSKSTQYLSDGTTKMTREEKLKNLEVLFGTDAMRGAAIMADKGAVGYDKFAKSMKGITAAEVAKKRLDNLGGSMEQLRGSVETLLIKIGTPLLKPISGIVKGVTAVINTIGSLPQPILNAISVVGALVSVFFLVVGAGLALLPILAGLVGQWILMKIVRSLAAPIFTFAKSLIMSRNAATAATAAQARLNASWVAGTRMAKIITFSIKAMAIAVRVLSFAFSGPGLIIIGLIALFVILYKKNEAFRNIVNKVGAAVKQFLIATMEKAKVIGAQLANFYGKLANIFQAKVLPVLKKVGAELLGKIVEGGRKLWQQIQTQLVPAVMDLIGVFQSIGQSSFGKKLGEWGAAAASFAAKLIPLLAKIQIYFVSKILPILVKVVGFFAGVFIDTIVSAISAVIGIITGLVKIVSGMVKIIKGIFTGDWALVWEGLKQVVVGVFQFILNAIKLYFAVGILKLFKLGFTLIKGVVMSGLTFIKNLFVLAGKGILQAILLPFKLIFAGIKLYIALWRAIISAGLNFIRAIFSRIFGGIVAVVRGYFNIVRSIISGAIGAVRGIVSGGFNSLKGMATKGLGKLVSGITGYASKVGSAATTIKDKILGAVSGIGSKFLQKGKDIIQKLIDGILSKLDGIKNAMGKVGKLAGKFIPGSPVQAGALRKLNRGRAGGMIATMIADGITKKASAVTKAMANLAANAEATGTLDLALAASGNYGAIAASNAQPVRAAMPAPAAVRPAETAASNNSLKMVSGTMKTDKGFDVYVKGQAAEVSDSDSAFQEIIDNMKKPKDN